MAFQKYIFCFLIVIIPFIGVAQKFGFEKVLTKTPNKKIPFSIENNEQNIKFLQSQDVSIKQKTKNWLYITSTPKWINRQKSLGNISDFYFEFSMPYNLDDTARAMHYVDSVQQGIDPLLKKYTGKGVIIGIVDTGLDYRHPDFIDSTGRNRVISYWNQSVTNPSQPLSPYNYGQIWHEEQIQSETATISPNGRLGHGTTVTGIAAGNGLANGRNRGMAPDVDIIFVETDFSLPNWSLTVSDACDFIFKMADSLGKPAVINLSLGSYLGSHDGTDPAAELMNSLVEEKGGRIIIGAAGNGGGKEAYHAQQVMVSTDTNFIWLKSNSQSQLGAKTGFFDLYSNINDTQFYYSFGINRPHSYKDIGNTAFRFSQMNVGTTIYDTIYNENGDQLATVEVYTSYEGPNYHMQGFFSKLDSTDYLMRFSTTGNGKYDLWSGEWLDLNRILDASETPSINTYPPMVNYVYPDSLQSIVSSWNCSPKIISVGNVRARLGHVTYDGNMYYPATDMTHPGKIAPSSSWGPTRHGIVKPDISAAGDVTLGSAPLFMASNPQAWAGSLDEGGMHMRNGGTSMASPVVAGIAALYLERCPKSTYQDFKNDLLQSAYDDAYTGYDLPNVRWGYGKVNAFELLKLKTPTDVTVLGDTIICQVPVNLTTDVALLNYLWSNGSTAPTIPVSSPGDFWVQGIDSDGCVISSDTLTVIQGSPLSNPTITRQGDSLVASEAPNYQWYLDNLPIPNATSQSYSPTATGNYSVAVQGEDNCKSFSTTYSWILATSLEELNLLRVYPNPATHQLNISVAVGNLKSCEITSLLGQRIIASKLSGESSSIDINRLAKGVYLLKVESTLEQKIIPFVKE